MPTTSNRGAQHHFNFQQVDVGIVSPTWLMAVVMAASRPCSMRSKSRRWCGVSMAATIAPF